jgi:hypothetical protein
LEEDAVKHKGIILFTGGFALALILGWFVFPMALYRDEPQPMQFSHKTHAGEKGGMSCTDCHSFATNGRFQGIPTIAKCAECHSAPLGESAMEKVLVEEYVTPNREIPWLEYSRQPDNVYFSHVVHVKMADLKCGDCHGPHGQSDELRVVQVNRISGYSRDIWGPNISGFPSESWQGMKMDRCVRCHEQHERRDGCIDCHK